MSILQQDIGMVLQQCGLEPAYPEVISFFGCPTGRGSVSPNSVLNALRSYFEGESFTFEGGVYEEKTSKCDVTSFWVKKGGVPKYKGYVESGYAGASRPLLSVIMYDVSTAPDGLQELLQLPYDIELWKQYLLHSVPEAKEIDTKVSGAFGFEFPYPTRTESDHRVYVMLNRDGTAVLNDEALGMEEVRGSWRRIALEIFFRILREE